MLSLLFAVVFLSADPQPVAPPPAGPVEKAAPEEKPAVEPEKPKPPKLTEKEKIEALLKYVAASEVTFIRNGDEYGPKDAVKHMQRKLDYAGDRIKTARDFIKYIGTGSSMSGKPYLIRFKDGREVKSADWLTKALDRIEAGLPPEEKPAPDPKPKEKPAEKPSAQ